MLKFDNLITFKNIIEKIIIDVRWRCKLVTVAANAISIDMNFSFRVATDMAIALKQGNSKFSRRGHVKNVAEPFYMSILKFVHGNSI